MKISFGFTFIELMVVITIGMMVMGTGMVFFNRFNERQKLKSVQEEVVSNLRLAQNFAKAGKDRLAAVRMWCMLKSG